MDRCWTTPVKAHKAIYDESVKSLYATATERFNLVATTMQVLLTLLALRFARIGNAAFNALGGPITSLHGQFTLEQMRARVWWVGTPTRIYQDDDALAGCLWNSLSDAATAIMALRHEDYTINGFVSGILLLKCILLSSMVEAVQDHGLLRQTNDPSTGNVPFPETQCEGLQSLVQGLDPAVGSARGDLS